MFVLNVYLLCRKIILKKKEVYSINCKWLVFILFYFFQTSLFSQNKIDTIYVDSVPKKILYDNKIYKLNAGFATIGYGLYFSNYLNNFMRGIGLNFNFHTYKELYLQIGLNRIKGNASFELPQKKDVVVSHFTFNLSPSVIKTENTKFAFIFTPIGISYGGGYKDETYHFVGKIAVDSTETIQNNHFGMNLYSSVQVYYKFKYDLGIGTNVYAEYQQNFFVIGIQLNCYFSAAFKGYQTKPVWYYKKNPDKN